MRARFEVGESGETAKAFLANGEVILFQFNDALSVNGHEVVVLAERELFVRPRSGNSLTLTTPRALAAQEQKVAAAVAERKRVYGS